MIHLAHLVNPVQTAANLELTYVQPITFETMRVAREKVKSSAKIDLLSAQYAEDHPIIPSYFKKTRELERSVLNFGTFNKEKKFPLLRDLLDRLYEGSKAKYLIYTNVDIAVQPNFYIEILKKIESGLDAFIINRRRIPGHYRSIEQIPEMLSEKGMPHYGFDCFVFHRNLYPHFQLENVCIGIPYVGITFSQNIFCFAKNFKLFDKDFLTFHIGEEVFKKRDPEYLNFNKIQFWNAMSKIWPELDLSKFPWGHHNLVFRLIKYGFHPSIPIRLVLMLEFRRNQLGKLNKFIRPFHNGPF